MPFTLAPHQEHPFTPFFDGWNFPDVLRLFIILAGLAILGVIGRTVIEGRRWGMNRGQRARFYGSGVLTTGVSWGTAQRFSSNTNAAILVSLILISIGLAITWRGVLTMRREQRSQARAKDRQDRL